MLGGPEGVPSAPPLLVKGHTVECGTATNITDPMHSLTRSRLKQDAPAVILMVLLCGLSSLSFRRQPWLGGMNTFWLAAGGGMAATATASGVWQGWRRQPSGACQDTNDGTCSHKLCGCSSQQAVVGRSLTCRPGLLGLCGALLGDALGPGARVLTGCLPDHFLHDITQQRVSALRHHPCLWCMMHR